MLDPKSDNLENETEHVVNGAGESKLTHLHKTISFIFGKHPSFKVKPVVIQEAVNVSHANSGGRRGLIFKLLPIVSLVLFLLTSFFYAKSQKEEIRRIKVEGKLAEISTEAKSLQASLEVMKESVKANEQFKTELEYLKNSSAEVSRQLEGISGEKSKLENTLQEKDKKINELSKELTELAKIKRVQQASELQGENQNEIIPEEIVKKSGKILVVNPASNIVAINLGGKDGIKVGSTFDIYSLDNNFVAKLIINEVEDTVSVGKISPQAVVAKVKENYIVKIK